MAYFRGDPSKYTIKFVDGIQKDFLEFNSGTIAKIGVADKKANLVVR
ncbi:MAG: hypothetical protein ACTSQ3_01895 [Candidatus Heimdallarchaeota archaeon]